MSGFGPGLRVGEQAEVTGHGGAAEPHRDRTGAAADLREVNGAGSLKQEVTSPQVSQQVALQVSVEPQPTTDRLTD